MTDELKTVIGVYGEDTIGDGYTYWYIDDKHMISTEGDGAEAGFAKACTIFGHTVKYIRIDTEDWEDGDNWWTSTGALAATESLSALRENVAADDRVSWEEK